MKPITILASLALAMGAADAQACTDRGTMLDRVNCEQTKFMETMRGTPNADQWFSYGVRRRALAANFDQGKITLEQFNDSDSRLLEEVANTIAKREAQRAQQLQARRPPPPTPPPAS
jgi:hypothetical protein